MAKHTDIKTGDHWIRVRPNPTVDPEMAKATLEHLVERLEGYRIIGGFFVDCGKDVATVNEIHGGPVTNPVITLNLVLS